MLGFHRPYRWHRVAALTAVLLLLTGCGPLGAHQQASPDAITLAELPLIDLGAANVGIEQKIFEHEGLSMDTVIAPNGQAAIDKVISGDATIGNASVVAAVQAKAHGLDIKIIGEAAVAGPKTLLLLARKGGPVAHLTDLPGKRIAVNSTGGLSDTLTMKLLDDNHVDYRHIQWVPLPFPNIPEALAEDQVDAAMLTEPFISEGGRKVDFLELGDLVPNAAIREFPTSVFVAKGQWVHDNPDTVTKFQRALHDAAVFANHNRPAVEAAVVKYAHIDNDTAKWMPLPPYPTGINRVALESIPNLLKEYGFLQDQNFHIADMVVGP